MNTIKHFLAIALLITVSNTAKAQYDDGYYTTTYYESSSRTHYYSDYEEGWGNIYVEYSPLQLTSTAKGVDNKHFNTATIGFGFDYPLGGSPVCIEGAFETSGTWYSKRYDDGEKYSMDLYFSKIPVNIALRLDIDENFAIVPFGGAYVKWNIYGEEREKDIYGDTHTWKLFEDNHTYDDDYNRFQFGYQAGVRFIIGKCFSIGASWKADITPLCKFYDSNTKKEEKELFKGFAFQLAYCF